MVLEEWSLGHCWACPCVPHPPWDKCSIQKLIEQWPGSCPLTLIMKKWDLDFTLFHFISPRIDFCCTSPKCHQNDWWDLQQLHNTQLRKHGAQGWPRAPAALPQHPHNSNPETLNGPGNPCPSLMGDTKAIIQALRVLAPDSTFRAMAGSGVAEETCLGLTGSCTSDPAHSRGERPSSILDPKLSLEDMSSAHLAVSYCTSLSLFSLFE